MGMWWRVLWDTSTLLRGDKMALYEVRHNNSNLYSGRDESVATIKYESAKTYITSGILKFIKDGKIVEKTNMKQSNPPKDKWIPAKAIKFNKNGSVSLRKG
jgi:hypothetical protein